MIFTSPLLLILIIPIVAVALWKLFMPRRDTRVVGSLALWAEAISSCESTSGRRRQRVTISWVLLLAGALLIVFALSGPRQPTKVSARQIDIEIHPSAELAADTDIALLTMSANALLNKMDENDRVRIIFPMQMGISSRPVSPSEASNIISTITAIPISQSDLRFANSTDDSTDDSKLTYRFLPSGSKATDLSGVTDVFIPSSASDVCLDAIAAKSIAGEKVQIFVAAINSGSTRWAGAVRILSIDRAGETRLAGKGSINLNAEHRGSTVITCPKADGYIAQLVDDTGKIVVGLGARWYLAASKINPISVAIIGRDNPHLRRFVAVHQRLRLVQSADEGQIIIANHASPPEDKPALVISAKPAAGWRAGDEASAVELSKANIRSDDVLLRDVDFSTVAIRRVAGWNNAGGNAKILVSIASGAILLKSAASAAANTTNPKRVYLTFDIREDNTNLVLTDAFVHLLANITDWLSQGNDKRGRDINENEYSFATPDRAFFSERWLLLSGGENKPNLLELPWPGHYRDENSDIQAVNLRLLPAGKRQKDVSPLQIVANISLPSPVVSQRDVEYQIPIVILAGLCWLIGWGFLPKV